MARPGHAVALLLLLAAVAVLHSSVAAAPAAESAVVLAVVKVLLNSTRPSDESFLLDPTVLCALRLAPVHNLRMERSFLKQLLARLADLHLDRSCPGQVTDSDEGSQRDEAVSSGQLALAVLALRASCLPVEAMRLGWVRVDLLGILDQRLDEERCDPLRSPPSALAGRPLTTYYQYALATQALCILNASVDPDAVEKLASWALLQGSGDRPHSIDEASQALVALSCLKGTLLLGPPTLAAAVTAAAQSLATLLLGQRSGNGAIGNIYSTALAVQALQAAQGSGVNVSGWDGGNASRTFLFAAAVAGEFNASPGALAQLLPALLGTTYLAVPRITCVGDDDSVHDLRSELTLRPPAGNSSWPIGVTYTATDGLGHSFNNSVHVTVPSGSNLLRVLEAAQAQNALQFSFKTKSSSFGPYLVEVNGLVADSALHQYWQLLDAPSTPLDKGLRDYIVSDGQHVIANLTTW
ncbi:cobalamin binding intrinsic factor-like [Lethenteron reissneri]|uniref:cobalamin binding intrinsic factor-like n=1 Tax=Lethenteron reissneri TaxID=7753 RepID=UPI002AB72B52|nr:cobalamin binding intrinsic factor-like [Lethenteron reissneri]